MPLPAWCTKATVGAGRTCGHISQGPELLRGILRLKAHCSAAELEVLLCLIDHEGGLHQACTLKF